MTCTFLESTTNVSICVVYRCTEFTTRSPFTWLYSNAKSLYSARKISYPSATRNAKKQEGKAVRKSGREKAEKLARSARSRSFAAFRTYSILRGFLKKLRAYRPQNGGNAHILFPGSENCPVHETAFAIFFDERRYYPISFYPFCFYPIIFLRYISAYP